MTVQPMITSEMVSHAIAILVIAVEGCVPLAMLNARWHLVSLLSIVYHRIRINTIASVHTQVLIQVLIDATLLQMFEEISLVTVATLRLHLWLVLLGKFELILVCRCTALCNSLPLPYSNVECGQLQCMSGNFLLRNLPVTTLTFTIGSDVCR